MSLWEFLTPVLHENVELYGTAVFLCFMFLLFKWGYRLSAVTCVILCGLLLIPMQWYPGGTMFVSVGAGLGFLRFLYAADPEKFHRICYPVEHLPDGRVAAYKWLDRQGRNWISPYHPTLWYGNRLKADCLPTMQNASGVHGWYTLEQARRMGTGEYLVKIAYEGEVVYCTDMMRGEEAEIVDICIKPKYVTGERSCI